MKAPEFLQPKPGPSKKPKFDFTSREFNLDESIDDHNLKIDELDEDYEDSLGYLPKLNLEGLTKKIEETIEEPKKQDLEVEKQHDASPVTVQPEPKIDKK
jgi:hypothetical protein